MTALWTEEMPEPWEGVLSLTDQLGYLGPAGTFSEEAALLFTQSSPRHLKQCSSIAAVVEQVATGEIEEGIVPFENALEGGVGATLDLLAGEADVLIRYELIYPVRHCLLGAPGISCRDIKEVYSHPQALGQCRRFLGENLPNAACFPVESTAAAARLVSGLGQAAAIAPRRAAEIFELGLLVENIQDNGENETRFVILSRQDHPPTGRDKTSLVFSISDGPGSLYHILGYFARSGVNLTRIESRPARRSLGDWLFFVDCEGHRLEPSLAGLWEQLSGVVPFLKLLGSYPREIRGHKRLSCGEA